MRNRANDREIMRELMGRLKLIYDNEDFVCGTVSIARDVQIWQELLDCIKMYEKENEPISSDDVIALALVLRREADEEEISLSAKRKIAAAML